MSHAPKILAALEAWMPAAWAEVAADHPAEFAEWVAS